MFDLDKWQEIFQSLAQNKLRTFLTAFGVFWAIFMIVIMIGAANGLEAGATTQFSGSATNSVFMWSRETTKPYQGLKAGRRVRMTTEDYEALKRELPEAKYIAPRNQLGGYRGGENVMRKGKSGAFGVYGDMPIIASIESLLLEEGRFINEMDIQDKRKTCVIGKRVKELLFESDEEAIGEYIRIQGVYFKVIGVFKTKKKGDEAEESTQNIYIPFTTYQQAFNNGNRIGWFAMTSQDGLPASIMEDRAVEIIKSRHKVHPDDNRAVGHFNLEQEYQQITNVFFGIRTLGWFVGLLTLIAGAIGVSNIMLVIVKERTKEFGIRRAIGAKPAGIFFQIVLESVVLTGVAGYLGLVVGLSLIESIAYAINEQGVELGMFGAPYIDVQLAIQALVVLIISGVLAGILPAVRALSVTPVEALRAE
ncbi:ABC transporter permease [Pontibacter sp. G13]|uniref:ABC transporter permease n=1 Tax=Pontibacter sp. G13 TaxID=3074898 RepID=UPI002889E8D3|nr:ABC transporter permease [Pontibacter sp. G13]WNJ16815.1 ABC transporter permease [Pontibacter sp. G13]